MVVALILTLISAGFLIVVVLIAAGLYKDPVLRQFERYAELDDSFHLLPLLLLGMGMFAIFGGILFSATVAPRYPPMILGALFLLLAYVAREQRHKLNAYPELFLAMPRWYAELRSRTTREERRRIAYMWLCLPRSMRLHLNGSDRHFLLWADMVILATVMQTVEDQEAKTGRPTYMPDLYGRYG
jgi:hypothetical protein